MTWLDEKIGQYRERRGPILLSGDGQDKNDYPLSPKTFWSFFFLPPPFLLENDIEFATIFLFLFKLNRETPETKKDCIIIGKN